MLVVLPTPGNSAKGAVAGGGAEQKYQQAVFRKPCIYFGV